jgi:F0F1-type ATP synthase assembly protein I
LLNGNEIVYNVLSIGLASGFCVGIGLYVGLEIDSHFESSPKGAFGGIVLGLASAISYMIRQIRSNLKRFENESGKDEKALKKE